MRLLVHTTIESSEYDVAEVADGDEAWAFIQQHKPQLVLLDIQMPGKNGLEVLRSIRSDPRLDGTRVILLSAKALIADVEAGMAAGADFYLTKPFSPLELLNRVADALDI
jgi:CheY-like chemotaxis protein